MPTPPISLQPACIPGSSSAPWALPNAQPRWSPSLSPTQGMQRPPSASMPSGTGSCHDHPPRSLHRLCASIPGALPPSAPRTPPGPQRHPPVPQRALWPPPLSVPQWWRAPPRPSCLWPPALSPVPAAYKPAVASAPPGETASRAALAPPLSRPRDPPPLSPRASPPRGPRPVHRLVSRPHAPRHSRPLHRHRPPWVPACPAPLWTPAPVPPPPPLQRAWRWTRTGPHDLATLSSPLLCPCESPLPPCPCAL